MAYGARILKKNWLPGGSVYLKVAFWDDSVRKGGPADHENDFVIRRDIPSGNVVEWNRRVVNGVKQVQRGDTLEWVDAEVYKATLYDALTRTLLVQPATTTLTPQQWLDREIDNVISGYVQRWRSRGSPRASGVNAQLDAMPDESARLEQEFRVIPVDLDERTVGRP